MAGWRPRRPEQALASTRLLLGFAAISMPVMYLVPTVLNGAAPDLHPVVALTMFGIVPILLVVVIPALRPGRVLDAVAVLAPPVFVALGLAACWVTEAASMGPQMLFLVVVLFAAHQLPAPPAVLTSVLAVVSVTTLTFSINDAPTALNDSCLVSSAILWVTYLVITSLNRQEKILERLAQLSERDPMTGAYSRDRIEELLEARSRSASSLHLTTSLMLIDVNDFKSINDEFGHPAGDAVLIDLVEQLTALCGPGDAVGRFGGDEFVVVLSDPTPEAARARAEHLRLALSGTFTVIAESRAGRPVEYSVSVGISHHGRRHAFAETLYSGADKRLYEAKRTRRVQPAPAVVDSASS